MIQCMDNGKIFAITYGGGLNELSPMGLHSYQCKSFTQKKWTYFRYYLFYARG